jgi:hypothetical protein
MRSSLAYGETRDNSFGVEECIGHRGRLLALPPAYEEYHLRLSHDPHARRKLVQARLMRKVESLSYFRRGMSWQPSHPHLAEGYV